MFSVVLPSLALLSLFAIGSVLSLRSDDANVGKDYTMCRDTPGWKITFEDDFNGDTLNTSNWVPHNASSYIGGGERQLWDANNVKVVNGSLVITTKKEMKEHAGKQFNFTSGGIQSEAKRYQKFGRFEIRAKLPPPSAALPGKNHWAVAHPSHWMMPNPSTSNPPGVCWPVGGEIDIMEGFCPPKGRNPSPAHQWVSSHLHYSKNNKTCGQPGNAFNGTVFALPAKQWSDDWHTFAVEWNSTVIRWFIDNVQHHMVVAGTPSNLYVPQDPFYMILDTAVYPYANSLLDTGLPFEHRIDRVTWCQRDRMDDAV